MSGGFAPPGGSHDGASHSSDSPPNNAGGSGQGDGTTPGNAADARVTPAATASGHQVSGHQVTAAPRSVLKAGRGVATAAWIAIAAGVALLIGISWSAALAWSDDTLSFAKVGETGDLSAVQLVSGMCLTELGADGHVQDAVVVSCDEPHRAEIFTQMTFDLAKHPGVAEVTEQALAYCDERLTGLLPAGATWVAWTPSEESWSRGDRLALCIAQFPEAKSEPLSPHGIKGLDDQAEMHDIGAGDAGQGA